LRAVLVFRAVSRAGCLASLIARAIATRNMFLAGRDDSIDAMASRREARLSGGARKPVEKYSDDAATTNVRK
jgi:hypothetical protein